MKKLKENSKNLSHGKVLNKESIKALYFCALFTLTTLVNSNSDQIKNIFL